MFFKGSRTLDIRRLSDARRSLFADHWEQAQLSFVDDPAAAVATADELVLQVMNERGYPSAPELAARARDLPVDQARQLSNLYAARQVSADRATTEDLRLAMVRYRALVADLLRSDSDELVAYPDEPEQRVRVIPS